MGEMAREETTVADVMRGRASVYRLLGRVWLREVDAPFWAELRAMRYPQNADDPAVNEAYRRVYGWVRHAREDALDVLAVDYARGILGSGTLTASAAYPYESVYTSEKGLTMQEARDEVLAVYRSEGVDKDPSWEDPEDHLGLELAFMARLAERCAEALDQPGDASDAEAARLLVVQLGFAREHLGRWVAGFCTDVERFCTTEFYGGFAQLAERFVVDDIELLEDIARESGIVCDAGGKEGGAPAHASDGKEGGWDV